MEPNDQNDFVRKKYLKTLPIWEETQRVFAQFENLRLQMEETEERFEALYKSIVDRKLVKPEVSAARDLNAWQTTSNPGVQESARHRKNPNPSKRAPIDVSNIKTKEDSNRALQARIMAKQYVYGMRKKDEPWVKAVVNRVIRRPATHMNRDITISFKVVRKVESQTETLYLNKFEIALIQNHGGFLELTKRVIAGHSEDNMMPGIVGQYPHKINNMQYLILMDDGTANYFQPEQVYPIFGQSAYPWFDIRKTRKEEDKNLLASLRFVFSMYPRTEQVSSRVKGQKIDVLRYGKIWEEADITDMDTNLMEVKFPSDGKVESIHRSSGRLMKKSNMVNQQLCALRNVDHFNPYIVMWMKEYYVYSKQAYLEDVRFFVQHQLGNECEVLSSFSQKAKKTTTPLDEIQRFKISLVGREVKESKEITNMDQGLFERMKTHRCDEACLDVAGVKTEANVGDLIEEFMFESDLRVPLLLGWKREVKKVIVAQTRNAKRKATVAYTAPCGKIFIQPHEIKRYIQKTGSRLDVDYFSFERDISLNPAVVQNFDAIYFEPNFAIDKSTGKNLENKAISVINTVDEEQLPVDFVYCNESTPHPRLRANNFTPNEDFKSGCVCANDCYSKNNCECHRLNEEFHGTVKIRRGSIEPKCNYNHKRLKKQVKTGIFECNGFCNCSSKCSNRVVQNGIRFRLQVFKTPTKGWGVRTLDDIPTGAYICTYAAEILDDADEYGDSDMYYADMDYISVLESQKLGTDDQDSDGKSDEGFELDEDEAHEESTLRSKRAKIGLIRVSRSYAQTIPIKKQPVAAPKQFDVEEIDVSSRSSTEEFEQDVQFVSDYLPRPIPSRYPQRQKTAVNKNIPPSTSTATESQEIPEFKKIHDLLNSRDYTLDARVQGNVGRFFNHSCDPNAYVQNVFIESHDLRFPNVAFFATRTIKACSEITWNYNYTIGSIPGRVVLCNCGGSNCKGRIL